MWAAVKSGRTRRLRLINLGSRADMPESKKTPLDDAITLARAIPSSTPGAVNPARAPLVESSGEKRYDVCASLGEGGMGEVRLCRDRRIGREVAMKVIRPGVGSQSDARARFEREARVQGQLEHPSIVPVYDLGVDAEGAAFFTMKRLRGKTLEEILGDVDERERFGARKLLSAFSRVTEAIAFAHARGVLHRDLKPANIMLGDYGEVWVLDWGLAKLIGDSVIDEIPLSKRDAALATDGTVQARIALPSATAHGSIMGTPGYMAPEQVQGDADLLDARTDVYALGAILYEILADRPLHDRSSPVEAVLAATLKGVEVNLPDAAPELVQVVVQATSVDRDARYSSARELLAAVERYLDGDRDLERRRELAVVHADRAREAAARDDRDEAIREVNRALAFDPSHREALGIMLRLVLDAPREVPREAEAEFARSAARAKLRNKRIGAWAFLGWFIVTPIFLFMGIRRWAPFVASGLAILACFAISRRIGRGLMSDRPGGLLVFSLTVFALATSSLIFGPFVLVSAMTAVMIVFFVLNLDRGRERTLVIALSPLTIVAPLLAEWAGVLPPSYRFTTEGIVILPRMSAFPPLATYLFLLVANLALIVVPGLLAAHVQDAIRSADKRVFLHLWHLRRFLPDEARNAAVPQSTEVPRYS